MAPFPHASLNLRPRGNFHQLSPNIGTQVADKFAGSTALGHSASKSSHIAPANSRRRSSRHTCVWRRARTANAWDQVKQRNCSGAGTTGTLPIAQTRTCTPVGVPYMQ